MAEPIENLMAYAESGSPVFYLSFLVTIGLSRLVSETFMCDRRRDARTERQMDNINHYYSWPPHCGGPANQRKVTASK